jgi:deoxycytidine triphosphate deaminase
VRRFRRWDDPLVFKTYVLWPGRFVLCHSAETTTIPRDAIATLYSKSSVGRDGLEHLHAGYGDQGFEGQWTWEFINVAPWPIILEVGKRYMQLVLMEAEVPMTDYSKTGRYQNQLGPTPSR